LKRILNKPSEIIGLTRKKFRLAAKLRTKTDVSELIYIEGYLSLLVRLTMRKLALLASAAIITVGSIGSAEAQRWRGYRHGGWNNGGAVAAGLVGGVVLGGLLSAATRPAYAYPGYGYGYGYPAYSYPSYGYRYGGYPVAYNYPDYSYPAYSYPSYGYYSAPVTRVVYRPAPVYRTRVVYREPRYRTRVVYQQPRTLTRVVYRDRDRARIVRSVRRDVISTGSIDRREIRRIRQIERGMYR
jgi:hypothetical protein